MNPSQQSQNPNGQRPAEPRRDISRLRPVGIYSRAGFVLGPKPANSIVVQRVGGVRPASESHAKELHWHPGGVLVIPDKGDAFVIPFAACDRIAVGE